MENSKIRLKRETKSTRTDSVQNRNLLIETTLKIIQEQGAEFSLGEIAQRAKVSRMTIYRNFPDKNALVAAVFHYNLTKLAKYACSINKEQDAFFKLLDIVLKQRIEYNNLEQFISEDEFSRTTKELFTIFEGPIERAKNAKTLRNDFEVERDLLYLITMIGGVAPLLKFSQFKDSERFLDLLLNGIREK